MIINEGIDQRELDMMQAERIELVRMENQRRSRLNGVPIYEGGDQLEGHFGKGCHRTTTTP